MVRQLAMIFLILLIGILQKEQQQTTLVVHSFTLVPQTTINHHVRIERRTSPLFDIVLEKQDSKGNKVVLGTKVRLMVDGLKAYHVNKKGYGSFDKDGQYVPRPTGSDRKFNCLELSSGMHGIVTRLYDEDTVSANFPVMVKFEAGVRQDGKFDPPFPFNMHLDMYEFEVIE